MRRPIPVWRVFGMVVMTTGCMASTSQAQGFAVSGSVGISGAVSIVWVDFSFMSSSMAERFLQGVHLGVAFLQDLLHVVDREA